MNDFSIEEQAKDFRAIKTYEVLFEEKNPSLLELQFLMFWAESCDNQKLINMIKDHKKWNQKKRKMER